MHLRIVARRGRGTREVRIVEGCVPVASVGGGSRRFGGCRRGSRHHRTRAGAEGAAQSFDWFMEYCLLVRDRDTACCVFVVQSLFPSGIIKESVKDEAPTAEVGSMKAGMEQTAGQCADGWVSVGTSEYPGVSNIEVCKNPQMAFVVFSNASAASLGRGIAEQQIASMLKQYESSSQTEGNWRILNGKQWLVVVDASKAAALQQKWGGTLTEIG
jgi:hypothetical protein